MTARLALAGDGSWETAGRDAPGLGVLDIGVRGASSSRQRIEETVDLAVAVERLGFTRFWMSEHHGEPALAHAAPEALVPLVAARTRSIRVGPAGILCRLYSPFKVAEVFRLLSAAFPGRIDLGLAGGGVGPATAAALVGPGGLPGRDVYEARVRDLTRELRGELPPSHPMMQARAVPADAPPPQVWVLGTGAASVPLACGLGVGYSLGLFLAGPGGGPGLLAAYRERFVPGRWQPAPQCNLAVAVACAETEQGVRRILAEHDNPGIVPTVAGTPERCAQELGRLCAGHGAKEVVLLPLGSTHEERLAACQLLARTPPLLA